MGFYRPVGIAVLKRVVLVILIRSLRTVKVHASGLQAVVQGAVLYSDR